MWNVHQLTALECLLNSLVMPAPNWFTNDYCIYLEGWGLTGTHQSDNSIQKLMVKGVDTVDGRNRSGDHQLRLAVYLPLFTGFYTSQVVLPDFWTINNKTWVPSALDHLDLPMESRFEPTASLLHPGSWKQHTVSWRSWHDDIVCFFYSEKKEQRSNARSADLESMVPKLLNPPNRQIDKKNIQCDHILFFPQSSL